jgi:AcrR family transcriptional regulator
MVRLARFTSDAFVDAALALVAEGGPQAASMAAISRRVGAPTGSLYHRFESRSAILATAWVAVHGQFVATLAPPLRDGRGLDAALALVSWARADAVRARFLLLNEPGDLFGDVPPPGDLGAEIRRQEDTLDAAFLTLVSAGQAAVGLLDAPIAGEGAARARFLVFDGPIALVRPHLLAGSAIPDFVDEVVREIHGASGGSSGAFGAAA